MGFFRKEGPPLTPPEGYGEVHLHGEDFGDESSVVTKEQLEARLAARRQADERNRQAIPSLPTVVNIEGLDDGQFREVLRELTSSRR